MNFNHFYNELTISGKVQLYLIPLFIALIFFSNDTLFAKKEIQEIASNKMVTNVNSKVSKIEIIEFYEKLAKLTGVKICVLNFDKDLIITKFSGETTCLLTFLQEVEKRDKIISLKFIQKDVKITVEGIFSIQTFHNQTTKHIATIPNLANPFLISLSNLPAIEKVALQNHSILLKKEQQKLIVTEALPITKTINDENISNENNEYIEVLPASKTIAIVGNYVLLNKEWLKVGDSYRGYIITEITKHTINFEKNGNVAVMEMFDDH